MPVTLSLLCLLPPSFPSIDAPCRPLPLFSASLPFSLSLSLSSSLHSPAPLLSPTRFFLLSSEERASPPKRKEKQPKHTHHTAHEGGDTAAADSFANDHYFSMAQSITPRSIFSSCHDHEGLSNNRAMRRRPVTRILSSLSLSSFTQHNTQPLLASGRARKTSLSAKNGRDFKCISPALSLSNVTTVCAPYFTMFSLRSPSARVFTTREFAISFVHTRYFFLPISIYILTIGPERKRGGNHDVFSSLSASTVDVRAQ